MKFFIAIFSIALISVLIFAQRPLSFSGGFIGSKMWNKERMVPYNRSVSLEIIDTIALLKYNSTEKVDTFFYRDIHNNSYRYVRKKHLYSWEFLSISKDSLKLQVGEPMEQNYFYKLSYINFSRTCAECLGKGFVLCPRCQGTGRVPPRRNGGIDESVGICPYCGGSGSITHTPCRRCNGRGMIVIRNYYKQ